MKKIAKFLMACSLTIMLCSCGSNETPSKEVEKVKEVTKKNEKAKKEKKAEEEKKKEEVKQAEKNELIGSYWYNSNKGGVGIFVFNADGTYNVYQYFGDTPESAGGFDESWMPDTSQMELTDSSSQTWKIDENGIHLLNSLGEEKILETYYKGSQEYQSWNSFNYCGQVILGDNASGQVGVPFCLYKVSKR